MSNAGVELSFVMKGGFCWILVDLGSTLVGFGDFSVDAGGFWANLGGLWWILMNFA